jgi:putative ABC transport system permease protein
MPENSPFDRTYTQIWLPLAFGPDRMNRRFHWLLSLTGGALALLKPGVTLDRARAEMETIAARLSVAYPNTNKGWSAVVEPYASVVVGKDLRQSLSLLFGAVGMVLLIGCVNLANVMLARGLAREREVAVRLALGAGRVRLVRQFLSESVLLSLAGGLLGLIVGYVTTGTLRAALIGLPLNPSGPNFIPAEAVIGLDPRVFIFTVALSIVCGVGFGLAPAMATVRTSHPDAISIGGRATATVAHRRLRSALIVAEVALAFILLSGAGLLIRSFFKMREADTGFDATNVLTAEISTREHRFASAGQLHAFMRQIMTNVGALPGVTDVAFTNGMPLQGTPTRTFFQIAGHALVDRALRPLSDYKVVSPAYFRALGLRLRRGRTLSDLDREDTRLVAVINETMARMYFANEEPVGQRLVMETPQFGGTQVMGPDVPWEVVGVIADERLTPFDDKREHPAVYVTNEQSPAAGFAGLVLRASFDPLRMEEAL